MQYYITICSLFDKRQRCVCSSSGNITVDTEGEAYNKIHSTYFLEEIFKSYYPNIMFTELVVLYSKVWTT